MLKKIISKTPKITALTIFTNLKNIITNSKNQSLKNKNAKDFAFTKQRFELFILDRKEKTHTIDSDFKELVCLDNKHMRGLVIKNLVKMYREGTSEDKAKIESGMKEYLSSFEEAHMCIKGILKNIKVQMTVQESVDFYLRLRSSTSKEFYLKRIKDRRVLLEIKSKSKIKDEIDLISNQLSKISNSLDFIYGE